MLKRASRCCVHSNDSMVFGLRCRLLTRDKKGACFLIKFTLTKRKTVFGVCAGRKECWEKTERERKKKLNNRRRRRRKLGIDGIAVLYALPPNTNGCVCVRVFEFTSYIFAASLWPHAFDYLYFNYLFIFIHVVYAFMVFVRCRFDKHRIVN